MPPLHWYRLVITIRCGGGGPGNPAALPPPPAPVQFCAGPPVRAADPDLFPRDSCTKARQRAEIGARFNVKMTNRDMRWWLCYMYLQFSLQDFFQTHLADSMSQHQPDVQLHQQVSYYEIKHLTLHIVQSLFIGFWCLWCRIYLVVTTRDFMRFVTHTLFRFWPLLAREVDEGEIFL